MGMFDRPTPKIDLQTPYHIQKQQELMGLAGETADKYVAPLLKEKFGYESQERQLRSMAAQTDLSDGQAVQETYNTILAKNPTAAKAWINSVMPVLKQNIEQQKLSATKAPTGTPENIAKKQRRAELMTKYGEVDGNAMFLAELQQSKESVQAAGTQLGVGASMFKEQEKRRAETASKLSNVKSAINIFKQAKAGSPAAGKLAENVITNVFNGSSVKAASEISRIASAGGLVENIPDFINDIFSGVKTQEHYDAFLKVLDIYQREQEAGYDRQTDALSNLDAQYQLGLPKTVFEKKGKKIRKWNPKTGVIE